MQTEPGVGVGVIQAGYSGVLWDVPDIGDDTVLKQCEMLQTHSDDG